MVDVYEDWKNLSPEGRREEIEISILDVLHNEKIPEPEFYYGSLDPSAAAYFDSEKWRICVSESMTEPFGPGGLEKEFKLKRKRDEKPLTGRDQRPGGQHDGKRKTPELSEFEKNERNRQAIANYGGTIMHEARHCEQYFKSLMLFYKLATQPGGTGFDSLSLGKVEEVLGRVSFIPFRVRTIASIQIKERKRLPREEEFQANAWLKFSYGRHSLFTRHVMDDLKKIHLVSPFSEFVRVTKARYINLPTEKDAFQLQEKIQQRFLDWTKRSRVCSKNWPEKRTMQRAR